MKKILVIVFVFVSCISWAASGEVEIVAIKPTPFFPRVEQGEPLKQIVQISVKNTSAELPEQDGLVRIKELMMIPSESAP